MKIICIDEYHSLIEFTGAMIENEQINEPKGESMDRKRQEEKVIIPPI